jgi:hypothetical protein
MSLLKLDKPSKKLLPKLSLHQLRPVLMLNLHRLKLFKKLLKLRLPLLLLPLKLLVLPSEKLSLLMQLRPKRSKPLKKKLLLPLLKMVLPLKKLPMLEMLLLPKETSQTLHRLKLSKKLLQMLLR